MKAGEEADKGGTPFDTIPVFKATFVKLADVFLRQLAIRKELLGPTKRVEIKN